MKIGDYSFEQVWLADFEFKQPPGERPEPVCMVAKEIGTDRTVRLWKDELSSLNMPPYPVSNDALFVAYYASAEISCHLALGWPVPSNILDLYVEFRNWTNGTDPHWGYGLLGALTWFGLDSMDAGDKEAMRELAMRSGGYTEEERDQLLAYCESDVVSLEKLLGAMIQKGVFHNASH
jgi:DNA polymerase I